MALAAVYTSTNGASWTNKTGRLTDTDVNNWFGVTRQFDGKVLWLQVPNNNLVGTIPIEIGDLTQLNPSNNPGISGSIPAEIGSLSQLSTMYLHGTAGTGNQCLTGATAAFGSWLTSKDATWQNDCADTDGDTTPNYLDPDDDGDGAPTAEENPEPNSDGAPTDAHDTDTDTIPDYLDANGGVDCSNAYGIPQAQCDYLVAAYTATNGATWRTNTSWTTHDSPCRWQGVTCSGGNVTIPTNIGDLTGLAILNLTDNEISGTIPTALTTITTLTQVFLNDGQLTGLSLHANDLAGPVPATLSSLTQLLWLTLHQNLGLGPVPLAVAALPNLRIYTS
jgi:hypothetical protein